MASLLVAARDFFQHPDPIKRARASCKKGYVVEVRENNANRGLQEGLPDFVHIVIPGSTELNKHFGEAVLQLVNIPRDDRIDTHYDIIKKYSHKIPPGLVDQAITNNGELIINTEQVVVT